MTNTIDIVAPVLQESVPPAPVPPAPETEAPVTETSDLPKTVTMSQEKLNDLIKSRQSAALKKAARLEEENARLQALALGNAPDASEVERLRGEVAASRIERDALAAAAIEQKKLLLISQQVQKQGFVCDATTLSQLTKDALKYDETTKQFVIVTEDGQPSDLSPDQWFASYANSRPYLVKGTTIPGMGSGGSTGSRPPETKPLSFYFGPGSNSAAANRLPRDMYKRMRIEAVRAGLVGPNQ
jgi:hypothetical protein